jgi:hypothetical protein
LGRFSARNTVPAFWHSTKMNVQKMMKMFSCYVICDVTFFMFCQPTFCATAERISTLSSKGTWTNHIQLGVRVEQKFWTQFFTLN